MSSLTKISATRCPSLYYAAVSQAGTFRVWNEEYRNADGRLVVGGYNEITGTIEIWTGAFLRTDLPRTIAHEAAHKIGYTDENDAAEVYAGSCLM
jgi:hypothetical protein